MRDFLGKDLYIGATVVYPRRGGSNVWLGKGEVIDFAGNGKVTVKAHTATGVKRKGDVPADRCVVVY